jgi:DNA-binding HxlR family transcriptional regulator
VPPKVEYGLTDWGQALCPALDALLKWAALREKTAEGIATTTSKAILMTTLRAKPQPE